MLEIGCLLERKIYIILYMNIVMLLAVDYIDMENIQ
jgi:hypothetical protein